MEKRGKTKKCKKTEKKRLRGMEGVIREKLLMWREPERGSQTNIRRQPKRERTRKESQKVDKIKNERMRQTK